MKRYLVLENGQVFQGEAFGADAPPRMGEVVFTTAMNGYVESLTDPSYASQLLLQTFPLIGNFGVHEADMESPRPALSGYIVGDWCRSPSNFRCQLDVNAFLKRYGVPGLCSIDTRALTRLIREQGTMNGAITDDPASVDLGALRAHRMAPPVPQVTTPTRLAHGADKPLMRVALWDFGAKRSMIRQLTRRGAQVIQLPAGSSAEHILAEAPDGVLLSSGPGDPSVNTAIIAEIAKLTRSGIPIMGICLGHQLLALATGGRTEKLKYGHRGANHPVKQLSTGRVYVTSQNHGYAVRRDALPGGAVMSHMSLNDGSCEGLVYRDFPAFSVQFHPETPSGPKEMAFLFDEFLSMMHERRECHP